MLQEGVASCEDSMIQNDDAFGGQHYGEGYGEQTGQFHSSAVLTCSTGSGQQEGQHHSLAQQVAEAQNITCGSRHNNARASGCRLITADWRSASKGGMTDQVMGSSMPSQHLADMVSS